MAMNEATISPTTSPESTSVSEMTTGGKFVEWKSLYGVFGLDEESKYDEALKDIWDYAKKTSKLTSSGDIKWQVTKLMQDLGTGGSGLSYTKLLNYVHVCNRLDEAKTLKREIEDGN